MAKPTTGQDRFEIREIKEADVSGFRARLDAEARERRYLALLQAPPLEETRNLV